jgi:DnaK suppressor protein
MAPGKRLESMMSSFEAITKNLNASLLELETRVLRNDAEICAPEDADMSEQASMDASDEPLAALTEAGHAEIATIKSALARIKNGTYGICTNCSAAIPTGRLEAIPTASLCISCAEEIDRLHHRL